MKQSTPQGLPFHFRFQKQNAYIAILYAYIANTGWKWNQIYNEQSELFWFSPVHSRMGTEVLGTGSEQTSSLENCLLILQIYESVC